MTTNQINRLRELCRLPDLTREQGEELQTLAALALIDKDRAREALRKIADAQYGTDTPKLRETARAALANT
jgi:hypothetical protein